MDTKFLNKLLTRSLSVMATLAMILSLSTVASAASNAPFLGHWQATDEDGSHMNLTVAGGSIGPFQITWTDDYFTRCNGGPGIIRGTGWLNESDSNLLEADLHLECFTTGSPLDFHVTVRYYAASDVLFMAYDPVTTTIWHRPTRPQAPPPTLNLRVDYGDDWVESFYEGGHTAWITVTESDRITVKATAQLVTEPKAYWGGETGFQSLDGVWLDPQGTSMDSPPDIQPHDWVFGWVDNGASANVQMGDISGKIGLAANSIEGTVSASWITVPVSVECLDWGSGGAPFPNQDGGWVLPNGSDSYHCSWGDTWDIQPGQTVGVGYSGPDGNWVANAFTAPHPRIVASEAGDWFWTTEFYPGTLDYSVYESSSDDAELLNSGQVEADQTGFAIVDSSILGLDLVPGNYVVVSDAVNTKGVILLPITMDVFDTVRDLMSGMAPAGVKVWVAAGPQEWQTGMTVMADPTSGSWMADFTEIPFDITEEMRPWSYAQIFDEDGDANEAGTPPLEIAVSSVDDVLADDGVCMLREAIIAANTNAQSGNMGGECPAGSDSRTDTIVLAPDQTYSLTIASTGNENSSADGDLDIWDNSAPLDLLIKANGEGTATISQDAQPDDRVLENLGATVQIEGLTLIGGHHVGVGGGVLNNGTMSMNGSQVNGNVADWSGGGIFNSAGSSFTADSSTLAGNSSTNDGGGGVFNEGSMILTNVTVSDNTANHDSGGITNAGMLIVESSDLYGNVGQGGGALANWPDAVATLRNGTQVHDNSASSGGGLFNYAQLTVMDSVVANNQAEYGGGLSSWGGVVSLSNTTVSGNSASHSGGGIHNQDGSTVSIENGSAISGNSSPGGGGIANWEKSTVNIGNSAVSDNEATTFNGGGIVNWGTLTVQAGTLSGNTATQGEYGTGGALANWGGQVAFTGSTVSGNSAVVAGGLFTSGGTLNLDATVVTRNTSSSDAGGIQIKDAGIVTIQNASAVSDNRAAWGGGISNWGSTLTVDASTVSGNTADNSGGGVLNKDGGTTTIQNGSLISGNSAKWEGGISNWGDSTLTVSASKVSDNVASGSSGGIGNLGTVTVDASTISGNSAPWGGGLLNLQNATMTVTASTIQGNTGTSGGGGIMNLNGALTVTGSAILSNFSPGEGDAIRSSTNPPNATIVNKSCIVGNGVTAVLNDTSVLQDFTGNWWGAPTGPGGPAGSGLGDTVGWNIDFSGWLMAAPSICP